MTKQQEEVKLLKQVITSLCEKLRTYQAQFGSNKSFLAKEQQDVDDIVNMQKPLNSDKEAEQEPEVYDDGFEKLLGGHTIGPLISEYEKHIKVQSREIQ